ncbi:MAG TPA: hypothetical protein K8W01_14940 [Methylorubrum populi]|uniref:DUF234 domain-containing protein n=1 Tax=Methylorubrum populi TaxID=223967 RepID=A0A921JFI8_9HYPH|nr:hypothetical protein [Methylorubrum populi]
MAQVDKLLLKGDFFFCAISGRRRIGKTSLIQEALRKRGLPNRGLYVQIPDSDERGVIQVFEEALEDTFGDLEFAQEACSSFSDICLVLSMLAERGYMCAIDEFQYFHRDSLYQFLSHLQFRIDSLRMSEARGGIFALGSIHTEMTAVLEDKTSPLFNRVTHRINVGHWDFETLFEMFREHDIDDPHQWLMLWSIFEGVPKFYRDCFDHDVLRRDINYRDATLRKMFFEGSSPLKDEADNWFLRELRGRYDSLLKLVAKMGPCSHGVLKSEYNRTGSADDKQLSAYLKILIEKYQMVERVHPIFAKESGRKTRYQITDNFLTAWLGSIVRNVQLARIRPVGEALSKADTSLMSHEGFAFEKMIRLLIEECSRKGVGDFKLSHLVKGYWNRPDGSDIEIDVVAINEDDRILRVGSCKRTASAHDSEALLRFSGHIERFRKTELGRKYANWKIEKVLYAPIIEASRRKILEDKGFICVDLRQFEEWLQG